MPKRWLSIYQNTLDWFLILSLSLSKPAWFEEGYSVLKIELRTLYARLAFRYDGMPDEVTSTPSYLEFQIAAKCVDSVLKKRNDVSFVFVSLSHEAMWIF